MAEIKNFPNNVNEYIGAEDVMKWLHGRTSGVFGADGNLAVTVADGMTVNVSDGVGWLSNSDGDGTVFWNDTKEQSGSPLALTLSIASATMPRIDRIVVSWETVDYAARPTIEVLAGTPAVSPQAPALTNNQLKRQISLAQIYVATAVSKLTADNITDERLDSAVCGLVTDWITVDTTTMQGQFSAFLAQIKKELDMLHAGTDTMTKGEYDPDGTVSAAGSIPDAIKNIVSVIAPQMVQIKNEDNLNDFVTPGFYNASNSVTVLNKPDGVGSFGLQVIHTAYGKFYLQILYPVSEKRSYSRICRDGSWEQWTETYENATQTKSGLMSNIDKKVLDNNAAKIASIENKEYVTVTLMAANWQQSGDGVYYWQSVSVLGMTDTWIPDSPCFNPDIYGAPENIKWAEVALQVQELAKINAVQSYNGGLNFVCFEETPTWDIYLRVPRLGGRAN